MYYDEGVHQIPHFHVVYAEYAASIMIGTLDILAGELPRAQYSKVYKWASLNEQKLRVNFDRVRAGQPPVRIPGL